VAVGRGKFGNPDRVTSTVGSRYPRTGKGKQTKRTQCGIVSCRYMYVNNDSAIDCIVNWR
jgi:hypothetical protein